MISASGYCFSVKLVQVNRREKEIGTNRDSDTGSQNDASWTTTDVASTITLVLDLHGFKPKNYKSYIKCTHMHSNTYTYAY